MSLFMSPYGHYAGLVWEILFFGVITSIFIEELMEICFGLALSVYTSLGFRGFGFRALRFMVWGLGLCTSVDAKGHSPLQ